jgi:hypothetical protein
MAQFSIFDCTTRKQVSDRVYDTAEEANHDYYMNQGHTYMGVLQTMATQSREVPERPSMLVFWDNA